MGHRWTPPRLFAKRVASFWRSQYKVWKTALDWTVWLYLLIPGLWICGGLYADLWRDEPAWLSNIPLAIGSVALLLLGVLSGRLRVFVEEADLLFLMQRPRWVRTLAKLGIVYTAAGQIVKTAVLFVVALPWLALGLDLQAWQIIGWAAFTALCGLLSSLTFAMMETRYRSWRKYAAGTALVIVLSAIYIVPVAVVLSEPVPFAASVAAVLAAVLLAAVARLRQRGTFEADIARERKARLSSTELLMSQVIEKKPVISFKRPLLFRRSGRIFRGNDQADVIAGQYIKSCLRQFRLIRVLYGYFAVSTAAVALSPAALGLGLAAAVPVLPSIWLQDGWRGWLNEPFMAQFRWRKTALAKGGNRVRFWLLLPGTVWLAAYAGWRAFGWWGAPLAAAVILGWSALLQSVIGSLMTVRQEESGIYGDGRERMEEPASGHTDEKKEDRP
ncbi:ABC transporter permease [Paenibacillus cisolokensis]|uniref:ABC transporter permease n=1 Tax=Paenibacillus cisolokensis TaxID=1658519 RepID=A0ABQ4N6F3_9BACL|nr:ABC transporter permease [Paenibacillus cisolokensis]GIQ63763.1 ABC transporter permease [Paenibacillus cisolokensis]